MKFKIKYTENIQKSIIKYIINELSFYTEPIINEIDFDMSYNKLILSVVDEKIVQIWGYSGGDTKRERLFQTVPDYKRGILMVEGEFEYGLCRRINEVSVQVYENEKTGWFCIGDPEFSGEGVEFITNCIAFVNSDGLLMSLWIKPICI